MFEIMDARGNILTFLNTGTKGKTLRIPALPNGSFLPEGARILKAFENPGLRFPEGVSLRSVRVIHHVPQIRLMQPADGAEIADNTPDFYWQSHAERVTLDYSASPDFAPEKTVSIPVRFSQSVTPDKPLAPGKWYWRVRSGSHAVSATCSFIQTAREDQDCNAPLICAIPVFMPGAQDPLIVPFREEGTVKRIAGEYEGERLTGKIIAPRHCRTGCPRSGMADGREKLPDRSDGRRRKYGRIADLPLPPEKTGPDDLG